MNATRLFEFKGGMMKAVKNRLWLVLGLLCLLSATPVHAQSRFIVRDTLGLNALKTSCSLLGCSVNWGLGDSQGQVFLVTTSSLINPQTFLGALLNTLGVTDAEPDLLGKTLGASVGAVPSSLYDTTPINYYGTTVREGYVNQIANQIVGISSTQSTFNVKGAGIVAVIDTGVDSTHPVLQNVLVPGYDFTRNRSGIPDEKADINQSTAAVVDQSTAAVVDQSTAALVDQSTAAVVDQQQYAAFGHGTMVSGVIHLVAPRAMIMPLKAFFVNGTGYTSDVIRAVYFAIQNNAKVINMSFSFASSSAELNAALTNANKNGVISVASAGNDGQQILVYPAAYNSIVMGVASTANNDTLSSFSNYGQSLVWVGAPGEGIVTLYPWGAYAATWGTSFSAPFVSGAAALLLDIQSNCNQSQAAQAIAHAKFISSAMGNGRLDLYQAVQAWRKTLGLQ